MEFSALLDKRLGFGYLRLPHVDPDDSTDVDLAAVERMVDLFLERGFGYIDTAYNYLGRKSEIFVRKTLVERHPRDSFFLTTKLPCSLLKSGTTPEGIFAEQLEKCGVNYFDGYLLHGLDDSSEEIVNKFDCFGFIERLKQEGKVRYTGLSFHGTAPVLDEILTAHPEVDMVQIQLNYLDWDNAIIQSGPCYEVCRKHNKPILVMEPVKGGTLAKLPKDAEELLRAYAPEASPASWALRFAASQPGVAVVLSGMSNLEQIEENTALMSALRPLDEKEQALLDQVQEIVRASVAIPCTGCAYCVDGCPMQIPIPRYFSLYNERERDGWQANTTARYREIGKVHNKASACVACRQCEAKCPQHIEIVDWLKKLAGTFEV